MKLPRRGKLEREIDQALFAPVNFTKISMWADLADLIANPMRDQRSLRIVEHDALFVIEPARAFVDLCDDRIQAEGGDSVAQHTFLRVEDFALPREVIDEVRDVLGVSGPRCDDRGPFRFTLRNVARWTLGKQLIELRLRSL